MPAAARACSSTRRPNASCLPASSSPNAAADSSIGTFVVRRVEVEQLDVVGAQPAEAFVALSAEHFRPTVGNHLLAFVVDATFGGDHHFVAPAAQRATDQVFALAVGPVDVGRIEMIHADVEALLDRGDAVGFGRAERGHAGDRPAAERHRRDRETGVSERATVDGRRS